MKKNSLGCLNNKIKIYDFYFVRMTDKFSRVLMVGNIIYKIIK